MHKEQKAIKKQKAKKITRKIIHNVRFAFLGRTEKTIAELLGISSRAWLKARSGGVLSKKTLTRAHILIIVHRPSPIELCNTSVSQLGKSGIRGADTIDRLKNVLANMKAMLLDKRFSSLADDSGFTGLVAALCFALWKFNPEDRVVRQ